MRTFKKTYQGQKPMSSTIKNHLISGVTKREPNEVIVIHHFRDSKTGFQMEVERRSRILGIAFERIFGP